MKKFLIASLVASSALVASDAQAWGRSENIALGVAAITYLSIRQPEVRVQNYPVYPQHQPQPMYQPQPHVHVPHSGYRQQCWQAPVRDYTGAITHYVTQCF
jgi:hypothetical protein